MTANESITHAEPTGHDEAVEVIQQAEHDWLRDHCNQCGRPFATTEDWATASSGSRSDLCWEPDGTCSWTFSSIDPVRLRLTAIVAALSSAGFLATEHEWGVQEVLDGGGGGPVHRATSRDGALSVHEYIGGTVVSRRVTAWTEVDA